MALIDVSSHGEAANRVAAKPDNVLTSTQNPPLPKVKMSYKRFSLNSSDTHLRRNAVRIIEVLGLLLVISAIALPIWLGYRTYRQNGLDQELIAAVKREYNFEVRRLLVHGASPDATDAPDRRQSLWQCVMAEVKLALHRRPHRARQVDSALAIAVAKDNTETVRLLLAHGAKGVNDEYSGRGDGPPPGRVLGTAALWGNASVVSDLIQHGASVNSADSKGDTPLLEACLNGSAPVVILLLDARANVDAQDHNGDTPLTMAAWDPDHWPAVLDLLAKGADPNRHGATDSPLMRALTVIRVEPHTVKALLKAEADPTECGQDGNAPLMVAANRGETSSVMALLAAGARVNYKDRDGNTAMDVAELNDRRAVIKVLKKHGGKATGKPVVSVTSYAD